jgi:hypothetical protein
MVSIQHIEDMGNNDVSTPQSRSITLSNAFRIRDAKKIRRLSGSYYDMLEISAGAHIVTVYVSPSGSSVSVELDGEILE